VEAYVRIVMSEIVKRNGRIQELDIKKIYKNFRDRGYSEDEAWSLVDDVKNIIDLRFQEFLPNTDNIKDIIELAILKR